jgi:alpha-L-rhamnosidase
MYTSCAFPDVKCRYRWGARSRRRHTYVKDTHEARRRFVSFSLLLLLGTAHASPCPFGEEGCAPSTSTRIEWYQPNAEGRRENTLPFERPVAFVWGNEKNSGPQVSRSFRSKPQPTWEKAVYLGGYNKPSATYKYGTGGLLRTRFDLPTARIQRATVFLAVNGIAEVYVDGQRCGGSGQGRRVLEPVLSQWEKRMFYVSCDATQLLESSLTTHTLGIVLGRGHWSHYNYGAAASMLELIVNNQSVLVSSDDGNWYHHTGPILEDDLFNGEVYDGRIAESLGWDENFAGWASSSAESMGWQAIHSAATAFYRPPSLMSQQDSGVLPTVTSVPSLPRNITWLTKDTCVVDFGANGAGWTRLVVKNDIPRQSKSFKSSRGVQITLAHGELVDPHTGDVFNQFPCPVPSRVCVNQTDRYTCSGKREQEVYEPRFTWHGYRYVRVTGCPVVIMPGGRISRSKDSNVPNSVLPPSWACQLFAIRVGTNFTAFSAAANVAGVAGVAAATVISSPPRLVFSSSPLLTSISSMIERTVLANQMGYQTSCPQREKVAWTGDSLATARTLLLIVGEEEGVPYLRNYIHHLADNFDLSFDTQAPDATIDDTVPHVQFQLHGAANMTDGTSSFPSRNGSWPGDNGGWAPVFPLTVLLLYETDGDVSFVRRYYPRLRSFMAKTMELCGSVPPPPIQSGKSKCGFYGDWSNPIVRFATTKDTGRLISTSYSIFQLDAMAKMAQVVGVHEDYEMYTAMASQQRRLFDGQYWNETTMEYGSNHSFVQVTSILALRVLYWDSPVSPMFEPNATRQRMTKDALLGDIKARGGRHSVGLIGWTHLFHVLSSIDAQDVAIDLLESEEYPSLGYMLRQQGKGTTLWERWDMPDATNPAYISSENSTSLNHPMLGSVYEWLVKHKDDIDARLLRKRKRESLPS